MSLLLPAGPAIQHTGESLNAPIRLNVYAGADGRFEIYEDDGVSYGYENGEWSRIPVSYDDSEGLLRIGERVGRFDGMAEERRLTVRFISGPEPRAADFDAAPDAVLSYRGTPLIVARP